VVLINTDSQSAQIATDTPCLSFGSDCSQLINNFFLLNR
jgi:hypothetical protein